MSDLLLDNWQNVALGVLGVAVFFWPQLRPAVDALKKLLNTKDDPATDEDERLRQAFVTVQELIRFYGERGDRDAEIKARELGKCLLDQQPESEAKK